MYIYTAELGVFNPLWAAPVDPCESDPACNSHVEWLSRTKSAFKHARPIPTPTIAYRLLLF